MKRFIKRFQYGERGFTLIELLVVVAILGVLAAVIIPNVGRFMNRGTIEAANTESKNVQLAVMAAMADANVSLLEADGTVGPETAGSVGPPVTPPIGAKSTVTYLQGETSLPLPVEDSIMGSLQATYNVGTDGTISISLADPYGKWRNLTFTGSVWK